VTIFITVWDFFLSLDHSHTQTHAADNPEMVFQSYSHTNLHTHKPEWRDNLTKQKSEEEKQTCRLK